MRRTVPLLVCVCLLLLTAAESAIAQQRLFVRMSSEIVELDSRQPSVGAVLQRFHVPEALNLGEAKVVSFGGGQSLAWAGGGDVVLLDTFSGAIRRFTFPGFFPLDVVGTDGNAKLVVLGWGSDSQLTALAADARSGRVHFVDLGPPLSVGPIAYASESDLLFVERRTGTTLPFIDTVDVFQLASGVVIKTLDVSPAFAAVLLPPRLSAISMSVNAAGTRLFVSGAGTFAFDTLSGAVAAQRAGLEAPVGALDELRNRFVTIGTGGVAAYAADSLSFLGSASVPRLPHSWRDLDVSGLSATIFLLESALAGTVCESQIHALHADTGQVRRTVMLTSALGNRACEEQPELIRITEPAPPRGLTSEVDGRHVRLTWQAPFGATQYAVEAGSAPGLANIATISVSDPRLVIDGVPSGTYHVRVRGINTIGKSDASHDVRVVVP